MDSNEDFSTAVEPESIPQSSDQDISTCLHQQKNSSHLWTHLSPNDTNSIMDFGVSSQLMEQRHKIKPVAKPRKKKNPGLYDPMKVF